MEAVELNDTARWKGREPKVGRGGEVCGRKARLAVRTALENTRAVTEVVVVDLDVDVDVVNG